jgi:hypothetical protein
MPRWNAAILLRVQSSGVTPIVSRAVNGSVLAPSIDALGSGVQTRVFGSRGREGGIRAGSSVKSDLQKCLLLLACRQISEMIGFVVGARPSRSLTRLDSLLEKLESPNFLFAVGGKPDFGSR